MMKFLTLGDTYTFTFFFPLLFSFPVVYDSLQSYGLQQSRACPWPSPGAFPSSCPLHRWCHPDISSSDALFFFCPQSFPASGTFPMSRCSHQVTKILELSLSISPSNEYSGLISFKTDWFDLLSVQVSYFCIKYYKIYNMSDFLHILKNCLNSFFLRTK